MLNIRINVHDDYLYPFCMSNEIIRPCSVLYVLAYIVLCTCVVLYCIS